MTRIARKTCLALLTTCVAIAPAWAGTAVVTASTLLRTPFNSLVTATVDTPVRSVRATVLAKPGSFVRPISVTYSRQALENRGYISGTELKIPVSFLYAYRNNTVVFDFTYSDRTTSSTTVVIPTEPYVDPCGRLTTPIVTNNRASTSDLGFDYIMLKNYCSADAPAIIDTDGEPRWVAKTPFGGQSAAILQGGVYVSNGGSGVRRVELDGSIRDLVDLAPFGVTYTSHHNYEPGRDGIILDVNTTTQLESVEIEIDARTGAVLNRWDMDQIVSAAMRAGGDDPSGFVFPTPIDWLHTNAVAYNPADNSLIISSRENFVIAVDYDTPPDGQKKIRWILGDVTKHWGDYPSLRALALTLSPGTLPPIGQHAVQIDRKGNLQLFDNGQNSFNQVPPGLQRNYSASRSYRIDTVARTATTVNEYINPAKFSYICGSAYQASGGGYVVNYAQERGGNTELQGLGPNNKPVFTIKYPAAGYCGPAWNALPLPTRAFYVQR